MADKVFKCDGFYLGCSARGKELNDEPHYTNGGREYYYFLCLSNGINPISNEPCRHCLWNAGRQNHWLVPRRRRMTKGKVIVCQR